MGKNRFFRKHYLVATGRIHDCRRTTGYLALGSSRLYMVILAFHYGWVFWRQKCGLTPDDWRCGALAGVRFLVPWDESAATSISDSNVTQVNRNQLWWLRHKKEKSPIPLSNSASCFWFIVTYYVPQVFAADTKRHVFLQPREGSNPSHSHTCKGKTLWPQLGVVSVSGFVLINHYPWRRLYEGLFRNVRNRQIDSHGATKN